MDSSSDMLARLAARITGPMHLRFVIQPLMAVLLGIRDGVQDAHAGRPPFLWDLCTVRGRRQKLLLALRQLMIPIGIAILLDAIVQYILFEVVRVLGAVAVGTTLMGVPYAIARGLANRITTARGRGRVKAPA